MNSTSNPPRSTLAHGLMFAAVFIWGTTFVLVKQALLHIGPQWFNAFRMTLGFLVLALVYRSQWKNISRTAWIAGAAAGSAMAVGFFFQAQGLLTTSATNSAFLTALVVIFVPFLATLPGLRARNAPLPQWTAWLGALLAFWGVALLTTPAHTPWLHLLQTLNRGDLFSIACAVAFALQIIALDHGSKRVRFDQLTLLQVGFCMVFLTAAACIFEPPPPGAWQHVFEPLKNPTVLAAIGVTGVLATALAFSIQTWAQQIIPPANIAIIVTLEPVFAWLTAFVVLHEALHMRRAIGALLVLCGILAAEILPRWRKAAEE